MNVRIHLLGWLLLAMGNACLAGSGGPDPYGYVWKDSNEPGIVFQWVDITTRPGAVQLAGLADDNAVGPFSIGWDFHYYWSDYSSLKIGSNGWISFDNVPNIASCFPEVPTPAGVGDNIVAPYMSDLTFISNDPQNNNPAELWYWTNNVDSFIVQWVNVPWWRNAVPDWVGSNDLQLILSGVDSSITFQYKDTDAADFPGGSGCPTFMEIGIENVTGNLGLNFSTGTAIPPDNYAVKYIYPSGANFLVPDATPVWNFDPDNAGQFVYSHEPVLLSTNVGNVGNTTITSAIHVQGRLRDAQLQTAWADTVATSGLVSGGNVSLQFPDTLRLPTPGSYYFEVHTETDGGQDINPTNNDNVIELVSVDNNGGNVVLSFASGLPPSTAVSWAGGNPGDGVAIKVVPPDFPAVIDSISVYITGDGDLQTPPPVGFRIALHGLDPQGQPDPGAVLGTVTVAAADVVEDAWNVVRLGSPVVVGSDGLAVAWMQQGTGIALGAEQFGAISRRGYEILGGTWAPYRSRETTEFLMRVHTGLPVGADAPAAWAGTLGAYPNPSAGPLHVRCDLPSGGETLLRLIDVQGHVAWEHRAALPAGQHTLDVDRTRLAAGLYLLQMTHRGHHLQRRVVLVDP